MKKVVRLTESDLTRIVKRVIAEANESAQGSELKTQLATLSSKVVPGAKSMQYCAGVTLKDKNVISGIKNSCTDDAWGASCSMYLGLIPVEQFGVFSKCTYFCARYGKYNGITCR